ncbi:MAG: GxxExxY protein [Candidatus Cloacimonetes bacterium]|nr:GxxExxY protein [Candidatus Cloacimonadota bacterium]MBL7149988.1 GxxExxY protein [Candidatus Cloacimonadota bacterium]
MLHEDITEKILAAFFNVYNTLGYGFLEKVYENSLVIKLKQLGFSVKKQKNIKVYFEEHIVGDYFADLIINSKVIIKIKAVDKLCDEHKFQLINYLKATNMEVGLLLNFGKKPEFKRAIFSNERKK